MTIERKCRSSEIQWHSYFTQATLPPDNGLGAVALLPGASLLVSTVVGGAPPNVVGSVKPVPSTTLIRPAAAAVDFSTVAPPSNVATDWAAAIELVESYSTAVSDSGVSVLVWPAVKPLPTNACSTLAAIPCWPDRFTTSTTPVTGAAGTDVAAGADVVGDGEAGVRS